MKRMLRMAAALGLSLPFLDSAHAICAPNEVTDSYTEVVCENGLDPIGVFAGSAGVQDVTVIVRNSGGIETVGDAIRLNGRSRVEISGYVSSGSGMGVRLSGAGPQQVTVNGFGQVLARTYGIYALASGDDGSVNITNFGLIGGPLNTGGIYASATRSSRIQNFGEIAVSGTGYGAFLTGSGGATLLELVNRGSVLAGSYGLRVHGSHDIRIDNSAGIIAGGSALEARYGSDIRITNSGTLEVTGGSSYGIYANGEDSFRQGESIVQITNTGDITLGAGTNQARGITAYARSGLHPDGWRWSGETTVINHGNVTGLGSSGFGVEVRGTDLASLVNTGTVAVQGGTGLIVTGRLAQLENSATITGGGGIFVSGSWYGPDEGRAEVVNSGDVTGLSTQAMLVRGRSIDIHNTGDLSAPGNAFEAAGYSATGAPVSVEIVNQGRITGGSSSAMIVSASSYGGSTGSASIINEGALIAPSRSGMDVSAQSSLRIDNRAPISSQREAILARTHGNGHIVISNSAALTAIDMSSTYYRIDAAGALDRSGSILIENSGRLQGRSGIQAVMPASLAAPVDAVHGDVTVVNSGDIYTPGIAIWAVADRGTATVDNSATIDADGSDALRLHGSNVVVRNSGSIRADNTANAINVSANGVDGYIDISNSGQLRVDEKSAGKVGISARLAQPGDQNGSGWLTVNNTADILSLGARNKGIQLQTEAAGAELNSHGLIQSEYNTVEISSSRNGGDIRVVTSGNLKSSAQNGQYLRAWNGGNIGVINTADIEAAFAGIQAGALDGGGVDILNHGAITTGAASYQDYISVSSRNLLLSVNQAALYGLGATVRIENHGLLGTTGGPERFGIVANGNTIAADGAVEIINRGDIVMMETNLQRGSGIVATVSLSSNGQAHVENYADISVNNIATGIVMAGGADTSLSLYNDGRVESVGYHAVQLVGQASNTSIVHNDKGGELVSVQGRALEGSMGSDHLINAGVIRTRSAQANALAVNLAHGDDVMEMIGLSEIHGVVDGGAGTDTLRWGGDVIGRFDMSRVGTQYVNFERFEKTGSSTWIYDGIGTAIDHLQVREGLARVDGALDGDVTVQAGAILGGTGSISGSVVIQDGGIYAPGASIGSQTLQNLSMLGAQSVFQLELDAGGLFDQVSVTGTATLGGILEIAFLDSSDFHVGWQAVFLDAATLLGGFEGYRVTGLAGRASFDLFTDNGRVGLLLTGFDTTVVPLPAGIWLLGSALVLLGRRVRSRIAVSTA